MPVPTTTWPVKVTAEAFERGGIFVDDDDFVAVGVRSFARVRADAAAPDDEISHMPDSTFPRREPVTLGGTMKRAKERGARPRTVESPGRVIGA